MPDRLPRSMKICPKCDETYSDDTLEFCLEDGSPLVQTFRATNKLSRNPDVITQDKQEFETAVLPETFTKQANLDIKQIPDTVVTAQTDSNKNVSRIKEKFTHQGLRFIEVLPVIIALCHNYWHWLYFDKTRFGDFFKFLISGTFIIWILLLISGVIASLIALKYGKNRGFAIVALVILAINLLLGLVPLK